MRQPQKTMALQERWFCPSGLSFTKERENSQLFDVQHESGTNKGEVAGLSPQKTLLK